MKITKTQYKLQSNILTLLDASPDYSLSAIASASSVHPTPLTIIE